MTRRVTVKIRQVGPELKRLAPNATVLVHQHADPAIPQALKELGATL